MPYQIYGVTSQDIGLHPDLVQHFQLETIQYKDVVAVVSSGTPDLGSDTSKVLELYQRQTYILSQLQAQAIIPTRFGTGVSSLERVQTLLEVHHDDLHQQLQSVSGMMQLNISGHWQFNAAITRAAQHPEVLALRQDLAAHGKVTLQDQAHVGELIALQLEHERQRLFDKALLLLEGMIHEYKVVPRDGEDSAFQFAILCQRELRDNIVTRLNALADPELGLSIGVSASMPVNQFRLLEVIEPRNSDLEQARQTLRLPLHVPSAPSQVWRAYKQLALEKHPDRRPNDPNANDEMVALSRARDLLEVAGYGVGLKIQRSA
jgi:Gas vesicle synthesis protein GvpL/GvpF